MTTRKNITQPADWWSAFEKEANKRGETLSEWLGKAGLACMRKEDRKKLSDRPSVGAPKK